jgi:hypothetical protein
MIKMGTSVDTKPEREEAGGVSEEPMMSEREEMSSV